MTVTLDVDAVVIGAGPNGLVAANLLTDRGWDVAVVEPEAEPGGAVRSGEILEPGFVTDLFSAFYPLAIVSPHLRRLELERWGLSWLHAPAVLTHPTPEGTTALLSRDRAITATALDAFHPGDGEAWLALQRDWDGFEAPLIAALMDPFPPLRAGLRLATTIGARRLLPTARRALLSVRRMAEEHFGGAGGGLLLAGSALHADLTPETASSGFLGWLLAGIGQGHGWPVPRSGSGALTAALVDRLQSCGGSLRCASRVERIDIVAGRAVGVRTADGAHLTARRAVIADVVAPTLYDGLLEPDAIIESRRAELARTYQRGAATFKVNWTLDAPIPWLDPAVGAAGTVHLAASLDELTLTAAELAIGRLPRHPFVLVGQMTTSDPTRSPPGTESAWAYTSVPQIVRGDAGGDLRGVDDPSDAARFAERIEARIEQFAPGFLALVRRRSIQTPRDMEHADANLLGGDKSLGTAQLHQQLVFRPAIGLGRAETPIEGLFLASGSAHPGGGVHGACGANAARAAIAADRRRRLMPRSRRRQRARTKDPSSSAERQPA
jgi:phytoene dehydrogenase-like protein